MRAQLLRRFIEYVKTDTESNPSSKTYPSTEKQLNLARKLVEELNVLGLESVELDNNGYVTATLPSNINHEVPVIGFLAHMDTSPDMTGKGVNPQIVENYDGNDIVLNKEKNIVLKVTDFPELKKYSGNTLITTDGTTLLGADDKAGIAEIMTALEQLVSNPALPHGTIKVAFTPDEEIGKGVDHFDVKKFGAAIAYTLDGGEIGELEYENFNAAMAKIHITGRNVHPGTAKNKMINSLILVTEFNNLLPVEQRPEFTDHYEGFFHLTKISGTVEEAEIEYIVRDHNRSKFDDKKKLMQQSVDFLKKKYPSAVIELDMQDQYYNMKEKVEPVYYAVEIAEQAMKEENIDVKIQPIRGGTDGARLSYMGLPCPNIFAGGHNFHGKYEYVPVESMEKAVSVIVRIAGLYTTLRQV